MHSQSVFVPDKTQLLELIHEKVHARPGGSKHSREGFLVYVRHYGFWCAFLAVVGKQQESPGQPLLAGVKKALTGGPFLIRGLTPSSNLSHWLQETLNRHIQVRVSSRFQHISIGSGFLGNFYDLRGIVNT